jgi:SAM-dependent methyltransferase
MFKVMRQLFRLCPIRGNPTGEVLHKQSFSLPSNSPLPREYEIVTCLNCSFVFADTTADQTVYNTYYTLLSKYEELEISSGGGVGAYDYGRLEFIAATIHRVLPELSSSILDMGCANGGLLNSLKQLGYSNILGIDPSKSCNNHVKNLGIECIEGDIFSKTFKQLPKTFDCIILTHVLEHIYDFQTAIINLSAKLNNDGILYIEVPDASRYSDYYFVPYYYIDCEHINHFDKYSLSNLIRNKGFTQIETKNIEFKVNESKSYPSVYSIYKKTNQIIKQDFLVSDDATNSFLKFIENQILRMETI